MMDEINIPLYEFNLFWDEVFGDDWYIDDSYFSEAGHEVTIGHETIVWQGHGSPTSSECIYESELPNLNKNEKFLSIGLIEVFKRWRKLQNNTVLQAIFPVSAGSDVDMVLMKNLTSMGDVAFVRMTVPKSEHDEIKQKLIDMGGKVTD